MVRAALENKRLSPKLAWGLTAFTAGTEYSNLAIDIVKSEESPAFATMAEATVDDMLIQEADAVDWKRLLGVFSVRGRETATIAAVADFLTEKPSETGATPISFDRDIRPGSFGDKKVNWNAFFGKAKLTDVEAVGKLIERRSTLPQGHGSDEFYFELYQRLPPADAAEFLSVLMKCDKGDYYELMNAISRFPKTWLLREGIKRLWPKFLSGFGERFAASLATRYRIMIVDETFERNAEWVAQVKAGIIAGFKGGAFGHASATLFGLTELLCETLTEAEAEAVLDYGLERFEMYIDDAFGDGPYTPALDPGKGALEGLGGLIWAALGAPRTTTRWCAAHAVLRLGQVGAADAIADLVSRLDSTSAGAFSSPRFPFYFLTARQYLLIALARVALDFPIPLIPHIKVLSDFAISGPPHAFIQKVRARCRRGNRFAIPGTCLSDSHRRASRHRPNAPALHQGNSRGAVQRSQPMARRRGGRHDVAVSLLL